MVDEGFGEIHCGDALAFIIENTFMQAGSGEGQVERVLQFSADIIGI